MSAEAEILNIRKSAPRFNLYSFLLVAAGLLTLGAAAVSEQFRTADNFLAARFCLPLAIGAALIFAGALVNTKWKYFAFWSALALVGQAAALQMVNAGKLIHFQHYYSPAEILSRDWLAAALFVLQIPLVGFGIVRYLPAIRKWLGENFKLWQILSIAVLMILAGAAVTRDLSIYAASLLTAAVVQFVSLANIVLAAWSVPAEAIEWLRAKIDQFLGEPETSDKSKLDRFALTAALWIVVLTAGLSFFIYENHPHVPDETQYLFQANYLAAGQLTAKAPPVPEAFAMYLVPHEEPRWFSIFSPGWSALLAVALKFDAAWLVNPLLAGLCVLLTYLFFQEIYSRRFARLAVLLLCCSPWFVFMAMSFMSHIFTLVCALGAAVLLGKAFKNKRIAYALPAGMLIGVLSLIRPLDGLLVALLLGFWTLFRSSTWKSKILTGALLVVGTLATGALVLPYNRAVTGDATILPIDFYYTKYFWEDVESLGFGPERGLNWGLDALPGHSPLEAVINSALNTFSTNVELFGWAVGSLLPAFLFVVGLKFDRRDFWAFVVIGAFVGAYSLFWYHGGPDFGARYWFLIIVPLIALTVRGIEFVGGKINETNNGGQNSDPRVMLGVGLLCAMTVLNFLPWRALDKYHGYLQMRPGIRELARKHDFGRSLVLIRGEEHPDYQSAWIYNPLNFEGDAPIYAHDKNAEIRGRLLNAYPDRKIWIVDGPTRAGGVYRIVEGPIDARELSEEVR